MITVNIHEAKTKFSKLLSRVEGGEEIIVAKAGKPIARIVPLPQKVEKRVPGSAKERVILKESFFEPLPEEILRELEK